MVAEPEPEPEPEAGAPPPDGEEPGWVAGTGPDAALLARVVMDRPRVARAPREAPTGGSSEPQPRDGGGARRLCALASGAAGGDGKRKENREQWEAVECDEEHDADSKERRAAAGELPARAAVALKVRTHPAPG